MGDGPKRYPGSYGSPLFIKILKIIESNSLRGAQEDLPPSLDEREDLDPGDDILPEGVEMPTALAVPRMAGAAPFVRPPRKPGPEPKGTVHLEEGIRNYRGEFTATDRGDKIHLKRIVPKPRDLAKARVQQLIVDREVARALLNFLQDWLDGDDGEE